MSSRESSTPLTCSDDQATTEKILSATRLLISAKGPTEFSLEDVSAHSGVEIAVVKERCESVPKILEVLFSSFLNKIRIKLTLLLERSHTQSDLNCAVEAIIDYFSYKIREDAAIAQLWREYQKFPNLISLESAVTEEYSQLLYDRIYYFNPCVVQNEVLTASNLLIKMVYMTATENRLSNGSRTSGLLEEYKELSLLRLNSFLSNGEETETNQRKT